VCAGGRRACRRRPGRGSSGVRISRRGKHQFFGPCRYGRSVAHRQLERCRELREKSPLGCILRTIGIADPHRHLIRELLRLRARERCCDRLHVRLIDQHTAQDGRKIDRAVGAECVDHAADRASLALILEPVSDGGHQCELDDGFDVLFGHAAALRVTTLSSVVSSAGARPPAAGG